MVRGVAKPFRGGCRPARSVHGYTGLDGPLFLPTMRKPLEKNVCDFIYETVMACDEPFTLVALGPLTNVAATLLAYPELKQRIGRIALMGGCAAFGNVNPTAEFNFWHDPDAARIVFQSGIRILMCGLDVTWKAVLTLDE
ncbi:MAG: nucleoside hydrolase, partial [Lachnospiraceae bacterium]|nr:nucleoside hydrolase [Lachnospiraceae bacterium]